jgi:hypothetical protein
MYERRDPPSVEATIRLASADTAVLMFSGLVVATAWRDATPLGAPDTGRGCSPDFRFSPMVGGKRPVVGMAAGRVGPAPLDRLRGGDHTTRVHTGCSASAAVQTCSFLRRGRSYTMPVVDSSVGAAKQEIT